MTDLASANLRIVPGVTTYGKWTAQGLPFKKTDVEQEKLGWEFLNVKCICGEVRDVYLKNLVDGRSGSCGDCKLNIKIRDRLAAATQEIEDRLRGEIADRDKSIEQLTATVTNLTITGLPAPVATPVAPAQVEAREAKFPPIAAKTSPGLVEPVGTPDIRHLMQRVEALLDPARDDNPRSIRSLTHLAPPRNYNPNPSMEELGRSFERNNYFITSEQLFAVHQAISQGKPILADGPPGTGKTEIAKQIAIAMGLNPEDPQQFHTLFCTPDIAKNEALYAWNDSKRLLDIQLVREIAAKFPIEAVIDVFAKVQGGAYSDRYLDVQSLLQPCLIRHRTVVLGDEIDKTYPEFDSYLLDIVVKNRYEVPGYGPVGRATFDPKTSPIFVFTTNRERELNRALARRLKPVWFDYLPEKLEAKVISTKCGLDPLVAGKAAQFFFKLRSSDIHLHQPPSTAEVIETCKALSDGGQEISPLNLFRYHPHWVKFRRDYDTIREKYFKAGKWVEVI